MKYPGKVLIFLIITVSVSSSRNTKKSFHEVSSQDDKGNLHPLLLQNEFLDVHPGLQSKEKSSLLEMQNSLANENSAVPHDIQYKSQHNNTNIRRLLDEGLIDVLQEPLYFALHSQTKHHESNEMNANPGMRGFFTESIGALYLPKTDVDNLQCAEDMGIIHNPNAQQAFNVTKMVDSWGKFPDGIIEGNIMTFGNFDECVRTDVQRDTVKGNFQGKYCILSYVKSVQETKTPLRPRMGPISAVTGIASPVFQYSTCMPSTCNTEDLKVSVDSSLSSFGMQVNDVYCQTRDSQSLEYTAGTIVMITLLVIIGCLLLLGTAADKWIQYSKNDKLKNGPLRFIVVFSLSTNLTKLFHINTTENKEAITCLYGMRVLSMTWVVWCHQLSLTFYYTANRFSIFERFDGHLMSQIFLNGYPSVDSFFFMSGLLVSYGIFKEQEHGRRFNIPLYYLHRILRLSPPILLLSGVFATFSRIFVYGPWAGNIEMPGGVLDLCRNYWWTDAVFISNFYSHHEPSKTCLGVTWYTSADFQMYIVTPIILLPFIYRQLFGCTRVNTGLIWLAVVTALSAIIPGIITGINHLSPTILMTDGNEKALEFMRLIYEKPWCRASPYLVGIWLGYILRINSKNKIKLQKWQVIGGWFISFGTVVAVLFGIYNYNQSGEIPEYNWAVSIFYAALHRLAWGIALAWIVFACHNGYGGPINTFLSHPSWQPVSRLTYCMFLVAVPVQLMTFVYGMKIPGYFTHLNAIIDTVGVLFIIGLAAIGVSLITEAPVLGLEKLLLRRQK